MRTLDGPLVKKSPGQAYNKISWNWKSGLNNGPDVPSASRAKCSTKGSALCSRTGGGASSAEDFLHHKPDKDSLAHNPHLQMMFFVKLFMVCLNLFDYTRFTG